jgi:hypothetical protein
MHFRMNTEISPEILMHLKARNREIPENVCQLLSLQELRP